MLTILLYRTPARYFYRVELTDNLFGEYTLIREWGRTGKHPSGQRSHWYSNLREAVLAADHWHQQAIRRGYDLTKMDIAEN